LRIPHRKPILSQGIVLTPSFPRLLKNTGHSQAPTLPVPFQLLTPFFKPAGLPPPAEIVVFPVWALSIDNFFPLSEPLFSLFPHARESLNPLGISPPFSSFRDSFYLNLPAIPPLPRLSNSGQSNVPGVCPPFPAFRNFSGPPRFQNLASLPVIKCLLFASRG